MNKLGLKNYLIPFFFRVQNVDWAKSGKIGAGWGGDLFEKGKDSRQALFLTMFRSVVVVAIIAVVSGKLICGL